MFTSAPKEMLGFVNLVHGWFPQIKRALCWQVTGSSWWLTKGKHEIIWSGIIVVYVWVSPGSSSDVSVPTKEDKQPRTISKRQILSVGSAWLVASRSAYQQYLRKIIVMSAGVLNRISKRSRQQYGIVCGRPSTSTCSHAKSVNSNVLLNV